MGAPSENLIQISFPSFLKIWSNCIRKIPTTLIFPITNFSFNHFYRNIISTLKAKMEKTFHIFFTLILLCSKLHHDFHLKLFTLISFLFVFDSLSREIYSWVFYTKLNFAFRRVYYSLQNIKQIFPRAVFLQTDGNVLCVKRIAKCLHCWEWKSTSSNLKKSKNVANRTS